MGHKESSVAADREKLALLYDRYKNRMYITACKILKDPYLAEDAVHNAFVAILKNIGKTGDPDSISTASYCLKAARSAALNMVKKAGREVPVAYSEEDIRSDESLLDEICSEENYQAIVKAIEALDEKYRDVLSLYYLNGLNVREIGGILCRKETTIKQQLARGRRKLIEIIEQEVKCNEQNFKASF